MKPFIKICGLTRLQDAQLALTLGARYLGFIFAQGTPRVVDVKNVQEILQSLGKQSKAADQDFFSVGVFLNESPAEIQRIVQACKLDFAQVHGPVTPLHRAAIQVPVIPAIRMKNEASTQEAAQHLAYGPVLLDTYAENQHGGTGKTFRHELAFPLLTQGKVMIAGGIGPGNIAAVYQAFQTAGKLPFGFDLSSGIEAEVRVKSEEKIRAFFTAYHKVCTQHAEG
ncbi:MAG: phosphoribosylanthranilate isomerase [Sumerlaeia bacterium]